MADIYKNYAQGNDEGVVEIIVEADAEVISLPTTNVASENTLEGINVLAVGSTAFCPASKNAWVLTKAGWIKIT